MKNPKQLAEDQQRLMRTIRNGLALLPELLKQLNVTPQRLARWMRRDYFRASLGGIKMEVRRMKSLDLELLARSAVATLGQMLLKPAKRDIFLLLLCVAILIEFDRDVRRQKRSSRGKRKKKRAPKNRCHPDSMDRDDYLLKQLEALA